MANPDVPAYNTILDEQTVMDGFHAFLINALAQAKAERLLDEETLASAEADLMVAGPALCLYFASLKSTSNPPTITLPRAGLPRDAPPPVLSDETIPPAFRAFFSIWQTLTLQIRAMSSDLQHDLARTICGHEPISSATSRHDELRRMALDLKAVAIEISQRRTFQERYNEDLQGALDQGRPTLPDGRRTPSPLRATFVPPPGYEAEKPLPLSPTQSALGSPRGYGPLSPTSPTGFRVVNPDRSGSVRVSSSSGYSSGRSSPPSRTTSPPKTPTATGGHSRTASAPHLQPPSSSRGTPGQSSFPRPASPTLLTANDPAILVIRETLYAQLADVLARTPEIRVLLANDQPRAYFAAVGLAILEFSLHSLTPEGDVKAVLGAELKFEDIPKHYQPMNRELQWIAQRSRQIEAEDNEKAVELAILGEEDLPEPRMDRVRKMLVKGVARGWEELQRDDPLTGEVTDLMSGAAFETQRRRNSRDAGGRARSRDRSPEGTVLQLTNRINALALTMTRLPAFRERQQTVFKVLAGVR
ncbi:hypothetical protein FRB99_007951 [Tulasnella sp. 403]|nr:hypothetical protein FRB99_007951 [Tulasnella sp. 403]